MSVLFDRRWSVIVGGLDVSDMDIDFSITKTIKREPNTAEVKIYNLSEASRSRIEESSSVRISVKAGYASDGDSPPTLFVGDVKSAASGIDGSDRITTIRSRDAGIAWTDARISRSYSPGTSVATVLRDVVDTMQIGRGNLSDFESRALENGSTSYPDGYVASGPARRVLHEILRGQGLRWSVQNGALQIQERGRPLQLQAVLLSPDSGLIGSLTKNDNGHVSAVSLIQPGLDPGRRIVIESAEVSAGSYEILGVEYVGSTYGNDWSATLDLRPL